MIPRHASWILLALTAACGSSGSGAGAGSGAAPIDMATYYRHYVTLGCQKSYDCCVGGGSSDTNIASNWQAGAKTRSACDTSTVPSPIASEKSSFEGFVASGKVVFHGDSAAACLTALAAQSCHDFFNDPENHLPPDCDAAFDGKLPDGTDCLDSAECASGSGCIGTLSSSTGTCQRVPAKAGDACTGYCPSGLYCNAGACVTQKSSGASCDPTSSQFECLGVCDLNAKTCGPPFTPACVGK